MIYKYYSPSENNFDAVHNQYFWFSKHKTLNDPFDMAGDLFRRFPDFLFSNSVYHHRYANAIRSYGTCCFSKNPLNKHLWALYASSYSGFVLGFDDSSFVDDLSLNLNGRVIYRECHYEEEYPDFNNLNTLIPFYDCDGNFSELVLRDIINENPMDPKKIDQIFEYYLLIKEKETWVIEEEKRLILGQTFVNALHEDRVFPDICINLSDYSNGYKIKWPEGSLREVYLGNRMQESDKASLLSGLSGQTVIKKVIETQATGRNFALTASEYE